MPAPGVPVSDMRDTFYEYGNQVPVDGTIDGDDFVRPNGTRIPGVANDCYTVGSSTYYSCCYYWFKQPKTTP